MLLPCRHPVDRVLRYRCCAARLLGLLNKHALFHSSSKRLPLLAVDLQFYSFHKERDSGGLGELGVLRCQWGSSSTRNERKKRKPSRVSSVKKRQIRDEVRPVLPPIG